jgi:hypothetical protein
MRLLLFTLLTIAIPVAVTGCSSIKSMVPSAPKPWVKPYERQNLADEIMSTERYPLDDALMGHLRESREGGRGADGSGGGGCGCN